MFLAHLSWKLMWAFLIACSCLSAFWMSVSPSVCPSVNFSHFMFFSRTTEPISTKLGTKHPWVKGVQVSLNLVPNPFPRGDNYEIVKIPVWNLKIFFSRTRANFNQIWHNEFLGGGDSSLFKWRAKPFSKGK